MASTPHTVSEPVGVGRYAFAFSWEGPYGRAVRLIEGLRPPAGAILDLGCGHGAIAEPLAERGYTYVGADIDESALAAVSDRGHEAHPLDLSALDTLSDAVAGLAAGRSVAALLVLDVLEHLNDPEATVRAIRAALDRIGRPPLIVSVPNVAHTDVAAKLAFGRFDYTTTGLLDSTHVSFFTAGRLAVAARSCGLLEVAAADVELNPSDQRFPSDHPALAARAPVAEIIRTWRRLADPHGATVQFVRAFVAGDFEPPAEAAADEPPQLTVVMRTQGRRPTLLRDALTCLAAQTADTFDVLLMVHTDDEEMPQTVRSLVEEFDETFAHRVSVVHVPVGHGGRARPLNAALERLRAAYVAFLDDDDLVTADWAEAFMTGAGDGAAVRSVSAIRRVRALPAGGEIDFTVDSALEFPYAPSFDLAHHLWMNQTPICSIALPCSVIRAFDLRFDEGLPVLEDWELLLRLLPLVEVRDTGRLTSIYQMWSHGESSASLHRPDLWASLARVVQARLNAEPLLLPAGSVDRLVEIHQKEVEARAETHRVARALDERTAVLETRNAELAELGRHTGTLHEQIEYLTHNYRDLAARYDAIIASRGWRILRRARSLLRPLPR